MSKREPIPAAFWWRSAGDDFEKVIREFLTRAKKADLAETGHDCGHRFEVIVRSSTHASGPGEHTDANYYDDMKPVTVRARRREKPTRTGQLDKAHMQHLVDHRIRHRRPPTVPRMRGPDVTGHVVSHPGPSRDAGGPPAHLLRCGLVPTQANDPVNV